MGLQHADGAGHRHCSGRRCRGQALDLHRARAADHGRSDVREAHAAAIVAHAALGQVECAADLWLGNAAGHGGVDLKLTRGVLTPRLEQGIDHADVESAVYFHIQPAIRGQRHPPGDAEPRGSSGDQVGVDIRRISRQLCGRFQVQRRQPERGIIRERDSGGGDFDVAHG